MEEIRSYNQLFIDNTVTLSTSADFKAITEGRIVSAAMVNIIPQFHFHVILPQTVCTV